MNEEQPPAEPLSRAEERLVSLLSLLRAAGPRSGATLTGRVMRTARWQRRVRGPLRATGGLAAAIGDALGSLLRVVGGGPRGR